jgi:hypothetical protein
VWKRASRAVSTKQTAELKGLFERVKLSCFRVTRQEDNVAIGQYLASVQAQCDVHDMSLPLKATKNLYKASEHSGK